MSKSRFQNLLKDPINKKSLMKKGIHLKYLQRVTSDIYITRHPNGRPICIFEISKRIPLSGTSSKKSSTVNNHSLLQGMPAFFIKLPGYHIAYTIDEVIKSGPIISFHVKKYTPNERFVGDFSVREFIKFLAATIAFCRSGKTPIRGKT